jgi:ubiquinone/menaquinone biosynthesis C-methylase UbiE
MDPTIVKKILQDTEKGYDLIAEKFSATRKKFWRDLNFIKSYSRPGNRVLDYGCGNGRLLEILPQGIEYHGIDISQKLLAEAKRKYPTDGRRRAYFKKISPVITRLPFPDNHFDAIYSIAVLHHLPGKESRLTLAGEFKRILRPSGYLIVSVWNLWQLRYFPRIFQNWKGKILRQSRLGWNDCYISFKDNQGNVFFRYYHAFTRKELYQLLKIAGFQEIKITANNRKNLVAIAKK